MAGDQGSAGHEADGTIGEAAWRVRLRQGAVSGSGQVLGAGVLLGTDRVLTCAHVVRESDTLLPPDRVQVDFPLLQGRPWTERRTATVLEGHWLASLTRERGDLAVLALDEPAPEHSPVTFHRMLDYRGTPVRIGGFPQDHSGGDWVTGSCMGPGGHGDERVQIRLDDGQHLQSGFSGAGVLQHGTGRLLGIVVQEEDNGRSGYMIPAVTIAKYFPDFARSYVTGPQVNTTRHVVSPDDTRNARPHGLQRTVTAWLRGGSAAWDVEMLFLHGDDVRAAQALTVVLNMADRERSPHLSAAPAVSRVPDGRGSPAASEAADDSGAPRLVAAGVRPPVGSIALVLDAGVPDAPETREALAALDGELASARGRGTRPAVAVLRAGRSGADPADAVRTLRGLRDRGARLLLEVQVGDRRFAVAAAAELLPADRLRGWLDRLCARAARLSEAERRARDAYHQVARLMVGHASPGDESPRVHTWTVQLDRDMRQSEGDGAADGAARVALLEGLSLAEQAVETYLLRAEAAERTLRDALAAHGKLCGRLNAAQDALTRRGLGEHADAVGPFQTAQHLLMGHRPPLSDAEHAVEAFERVARHLVARHDEANSGPGEAR